MSKTKDAFIRMREQELINKDIYSEKMNIVPVQKTIFNMVDDLILKCIKDKEVEITIKVSPNEGNFDTDETNVLENVNIYIECSGIIYEYSVAKFYFFSVSDIVKVCKENCMRFPNEPTLYDIRDCAKEIIELMLSKS